MSEPQRRLVQSALGVQTVSEHRGSEDADSKEREYRDERRNVQHHTRTYMEQDEGERDKRQHWHQRGAASPAPLGLPPKAMLPPKGMAAKRLGTYPWRHALGGDVQ